MTFRIGAIFSQVGISFKISHKVVKLIWNDLEKEINFSDEYKKAHKDYRETTIKLWKAGKWVIKIAGETMTPGVDDNKVDKEYLALAKIFYYI